VQAWWEIGCICTTSTFAVAWFRYTIDFPVSQVTGNSNFSKKGFFVVVEEYKAQCINVHFKGMRVLFSWESYWFFRSSNG